MMTKEWHPQSGLLCTERLQCGQDDVREGDTSRPLHSCPTRQVSLPLPPNVMEEDTEVRGTAQSRTARQCSASTEAETGLTAVSLPSQSLGTCLSNAPPGGSWEAAAASSSPYTGQPGPGSIPDPLAFCPSGRSASVWRWRSSCSSPPAYSGMGTSLSIGSNYPCCLS